MYHGSKKQKKKSHQQFAVSVYTLAKFISFFDLHCAFVTYLSFPPPSQLHVKLKLDFFL